MKMVVMTRRSGLSCLLASAVVLTAAGCSQDPQAGAAAGADQLSIVAAAYPFQFVAERVAGTDGQVTSLTQPGSEPHDLELTPRQLASVIDADLVVYEKTFQAAVDAAMAQSGRDNALDTTTVVPLEDLGTGVGHDHVEDEQHAGEEGHAEESGLDPHVWLDPANLATIGVAVAERLAAVDPDHADDYTANAKALESDLTALDEEYRAALGSCERTEFITTHAAFGYLAGRYGLTQIGISGLSPDAEPPPGRIAAVQAEAREHGITTIFYETLVSPDVATSIAEDSGLRTDILDPVEGITSQSRGTDYLSVMRSNLTALGTANGCR
jgi:zinc transport system substrate-binding protein